VTVRQLLPNQIYNNWKEIHGRVQNLEDVAMKLFLEISTSSTS
jgi:hypothetical protein